MEREDFEIVFTGFDTLQELFIVTELFCACCKKVTLRGQIFDEFEIEFFTSLQSEVRKFSSEINLKNLSTLSHPIHHSLLTFVKHWPFLLTSNSLVSRKEINRYHMMMHKLLSGSFWWETHSELCMTSLRPVLHIYWGCQKLRLPLSHSICLFLLIDFFLTWCVR